MPSRISITVAGKPVPKARARVTEHGTYTPKNTAQAEKVMRWMMRDYCATPLTGAVRLTVTFIFRRPDSWPKAKRIEVDEGALIDHTKRPDLDNLCKLIKDSGNGILWADDAQVSRLVAQKFYGAQNETRITVEEVAAANLEPDPK